MKRPVLVVLCNALDDRTRLDRGVTTDSPAASRKVFMLCRAVRLAGGRPYVLSLGRGRADGTFRFYPGRVRRVVGLPVVYSAFSHVRILSELFSLFGLVGVLLRLSGSNKKAILFYNRMPAYLPALIVASIAGYRCHLDLEDGEVPGENAGSVRRLIGVFLRWVFDRLCWRGALLACSALAAKTAIRPLLCYYGTAPSGEGGDRWNGERVTVLMSGTLAPNTGADRLADAIRHIRRTAPEWGRRIAIEVTGQGPSLEAFRALAAEPGVPLIRVHGRTSAAQYSDVLRRSEVGLALKPIRGPLADTTFPSKVVEFAASGLLVLSTDISDVRVVLGPGAVYSRAEDPLELVELLKWVVENRQEASRLATEGMLAVQRNCEPSSAGRAVKTFIFGAQE